MNLLRFSIWDCVDNNVRGVSKEVVPGLATCWIQVRCIVWLHIKLLVIFNIFLIHVLLVLYLDLLDGSGRAMDVSATHSGRLCVSLMLCLVSWRCNSPVRGLRSHVLRALPLTGSLLDGLPEHLLLAPHKFLPLSGLPLADLLELIELGHLHLGFLPLLVSDPAFPLALLDPNVL